MRVKIYEIKKCDRKTVFQIRNEKITKLRGEIWENIVILRNGRVKNVRIQNVRLKNMGLNNVSI